MAVIAYPLSPRSILGHEPPGTPLRRLRIVSEGARAPLTAEVLPLRRAASVRGARSAPASVGLARRLVLFVGALAGASALWFGCGALSSLRSEPPVKLAGVTKVAGGYLYVVRPGDTLWSIATAIDQSADPRPLVDALVAELGSAVVRPGERIEIPTR